MSKKSNQDLEEIFPTEILHKHNGYNITAEKIRGWSNAGIGYYLKGDIIIRHDIKKKIKGGQSRTLDYDFDLHCFECRYEDISKGIEHKILMKYGRHVKPDSELHKAIQEFSKEVKNANDNFVKYQTKRKSG